MGQMLNDQTQPILVCVLTGNFLLLLLNLGCTLNQRSICFRYLLCLLVQGFLLYCLESS